MWDRARGCYPSGRGEVLAPQGELSSACQGSCCVLGTVSAYEPGTAAEDGSLPPAWGAVLRVRRARTGVLSTKRLPEPGTTSGARAKERELPLLRIEAHQRADNFFLHQDLIFGIASIELPVSITASATVGASP
jgi:hypothetical protein